MAGEREEGRGNESAWARTNERGWGRRERQVAGKQDSRYRNESASDKIWGRLLTQPEEAIKLPYITVLRVNCFLRTVVLKQ